MEFGCLDFSVLNKPANTSYSLKTEITKPDKLNAENKPILTTQNKPASPVYFTTFQFTFGNPLSKPANLGAVTKAMGRVTE